MTKVETILKGKSKMSQSLSELLAFLEMERDRKGRAREHTHTHKLQETPECCTSNVLKTRVGSTLAASDLLSPGVSETLAQIPNADCVGSDT